MRAFYRVTMVVLDKLTTIQGRYGCDIGSESSVSAQTTMVALYSYTSDLNEDRQYIGLYQYLLFCLVTLAFPS